MGTAWDREDRIHNGPWGNILSWPTEVCLRSDPPAGGVARVLLRSRKTSESKQMKGPKTYDEYVDLVHQAVYEVDEMRAGIDYDPENAERWSTMLDHLDGVLRKLYDDMISDKYEFPTGKDLPYMQFLNRWGKEIPFKQLLVVVNKAHKDGLSRE